MIDNWDELEAAAKAATPGPWVAKPDTGITCGDCEISLDYEAIIFSKVTSGGVCNVQDGGYGRADADFIALANPETVLRLIAENRKLCADISAEQAHRNELLKFVAAAEREICAKIADTKERASHDMKHRRAQEAASSQELSFHEGAETMAIAIAAAIRSGK